MKKVFAWMERHEWFLICLATVILLRIPSLFEPYWYGDEGIYLAIGQALRKGVILYSQIHDNKPPLLYLMAAVANGEIFWFKFLAGVFNLIAISIFYKLARKLTEKKAVLATWIFALLTTLPILEGNIANAENFFLAFSVGAFYLLWTEKYLGQILLGGIVLGIGALFKMPPIVEACIWPVYWFIYKDKRWFLKSIFLGVGVIIPILLSIVWYGMSGNGKDYLIAAWSQNIPYLTSWKATSDATGIYSLKNRIVILGLMTGIIVFWGKGKEKQKTVVLLWTIFTWFASLLSGRPYPHYLLQMTPAIALWTVSGWVGISGSILLITSWLLFQFYLYPVGRYYLNWGKFIFNRSDIQKYRNYFNTQVQTNYDISQKINAITINHDKIFVWGDEPMIYAISKRLPIGKYLVKYHINDFDAKSSVFMKIKDTPPEVVVIFSNTDSFDDLYDFVRQNYHPIDKIGGAEIWKMNASE